MRTRRSVRGANSAAHDDAGGAGAEAGGAGAEAGAPGVRGSGGDVFGAEGSETGRVASAMITSRSVRGGAPVTWPR